MPKLSDVATVARKVGAAGNSGSKSIRVNTIEFDLTEIGYCSRLVREIHEAAEGGPPGCGFDYRGGHFGCCAAKTEHTLKTAGLSVIGDPQPGAIVCFNHPPNGKRCKYCGRRVGHIAIYIGENMIVENTSSLSRGPGTHIHHLTEGLRQRISGYYNAFPAIVAEEVDVDKWALPWVQRAIDEGLLTGYPDGTFRGRQPVTRQELAVALVRLKDISSLNSRLSDE